MSMKQEVKVVRGDVHHDAAQWVNKICAEEFGWRIWKVFQEPARPGMNSELTFVLKRAVIR